MIRKTLRRRMTAVLLCVTTAVTFVGCSAEEEQSEKKVSVPDYMNEQLELLIDCSQRLEEFNSAFDGENGNIMEMDKISDIQSAIDQGKQSVNGLTTLLSDVQSIKETLEEKNVDKKADEVKELHEALMMYAKWLQAVTAEEYGMQSFYYNVYDTQLAMVTSDTTGMNEYEQVELYRGKYNNGADVIGEGMVSNSLASLAEQMVDNYEMVAQYYEKYMDSAIIPDYLEMKSNLGFAQIMRNRISKCLKEMESIVSYEKKYIADTITEDFAVLAEEITDNIKAVKKGKKTTEYSYLGYEGKEDIVCLYENTIYPKLYEGEDALVTVIIGDVLKEKEIMISVEVPGVMDEYVNTYTINQHRSRINIKPLITASDDKLSSSSDKQIKIKITDVESGQLIFMKTEDIKIMSVYDWPSYLDGNANYESAVAWLEPESDEVKEMKRWATEYMNELSFIGNITSDSLPGYQFGISQEEAALYTEEEIANMRINYCRQQVMAVLCGMSAMGVRYNNSSFSLGNIDSSNDTYIQRVTTPSETLNSQSGICIETSLLVASALKAMDMHVFLVITPGHCQVAVEVDEATSHYFLVETTNIPEYLPESVEQVQEEYVCYANMSAWLNLIQNARKEGTCAIIDCDNLDIY